MRIKEGVGIALFSRAASSQVSSAPVSLTTVFGMGTGGSSPSLTPTLPFIQDAYTPYIPPVKAYLQNRITHPIQVTRKNSSSFSILHSRYALNLLLWSSPRPISISQLNTSRHLHLWPINHIVFVGSYQLALWDILSHGGLHA